jgi:hypothetical protein
MLARKTIARTLYEKYHARYILIALFSLNTLYASGQKTTYLDLNGGFTYQVIKDNAMSPVRYQGALPTLSFAIMREKQGKRLIEIRLPVQYGLIHARQMKEYASMKGNMFRCDLDYIYLRHTNLIKDSLKGEFFIGGSLHTFLDVKYMPQLDNSAIIYNNFNSLALSAAYWNAFKFHKKILTHYHRISFPLLSYGTRPGYMNVYDVTNPYHDDLLKAALSHARVCSVGSFGRMMIRNSLFYSIRGNNQLGITYEWQYYGASFTEQIRAASHAIMFSLLVNL